MGRLRDFIRAVIDPVGEDMKTSHEWFALTGIDWKGLDPDGWDRARLEESFEEKITGHTYISRLGQSTFTGRRDMYIGKYHAAKEKLQSMGKI